MRPKKERRGGWIISSILSSSLSSPAQNRPRLIIYHFRFVILSFTHGILGLYIYSRSGGLMVMVMDRWWGHAPWIDKSIISQWTNGVNGLETKTFVFCLPSRLVSSHLIPFHSCLPAAGVHKMNINHRGRERKRKEKKITITHDTPARAINQTKHHRQLDLRRKRKILT